jgi:hypothetical protein
MRHLKAQIAHVPNGRSPFSHKLILSFVSNSFVARFLHLLSQSALVSDCIS